MVVLRGVYGYWQTGKTPFMFEQSWVIHLKVAVLGLVTGITTQFKSVPGSLKNVETIAINLI